MMRTRATIRVSDIAALVNFRNRRSTCPPELRKGWNSLVSDLLLKTGNYHGFRFLLQDEVPNGESCGIIPDYQNPANHQFPDESRIVYLGFDGCQGGEFGNEWANEYAERAVA